MPLRAPGRQRQYGVESIQRLYRRLLVDAEDRSVRWGLNIQPNHIGGFGLEFRIVRTHIAVEAVRLQPMLGPYPRHHHVGSAQCLTELARAPMGSAVGRLALQSPLQNARLQARRQHTRRLAAVAAVQTRDAFSSKPFAPTVDEPTTARQSVTDVIPTMAHLLVQDQSRPARVFRTAAATIACLVSSMRSDW